MAPPGGAARRAPLLLAAVAAAAVRLSRGAVLSSSKLESCLNEGSENMDCDKKVVLTVTLEHGQLETETAQFTVSEVLDGDNGNKPVQLQKPWLLTWTKSPAYWRYPLAYVQEVNNKPTEHVIYTTGLSCRDNPQGPIESLTCGVATKGGEAVVDSEGFCCGCDLNNVFAGTPTRSDLDCPLIPLEESAHCLGWDELWYQVYEVRPPQVFYDITVSLAKPDDPTSSWRNVSYSDARLTLSHQDPLAQAEGGDLVVQLVGDLATASAPHSLESRYLVVPTEPASHERVDADNPLTHAMLVDKAKFDLSGLTCDKIGVSYSAFKWQANACYGRLGSCLGSQLDDVYQDDQERIAAGSPPTSLVSSFCEGAIEVGAQQAAAGTTLFLGCPLQQRHTTLLRLEVRAEDVMFVTNVAPGTIVRANASRFEALSGGGEVHLVILSTGSVVADFTVGVADCSPGLAAGPAVTASLGPWESSEHRIALFFSQTVGGHFTCVATLKNAVGGVEDHVVIQVNITDQEIDYGAQVPTDRDGQASSDDRLYASCQDLCPSVLDLMCAVVHGCWGRLGATLASLALLLGALYCCWLGVRRGAFCRMAECCCGESSAQRGRSATVDARQLAVFSVAPVAPRGGAAVKAAARRSPPRAGRE